ncbi:uncharacterized protein [Parasteatoda tepidariorum]|uniref:uncharacterized protein n=1 Tax=Parasteatoda tepidariorum TaxID=114398 RepID=UPI001C71E2AA|nr:uncharacterized protein LOC107444109 [Parasteatoda tepidariorum]XP_042896960.1 uncharacterized protein LOC107444109 [Parasteatoda tepidariorum]
MMTSPIRSEGDRYNTPYPRNAKRQSSLFHSGVLLLEDAERAPEYLRITIDSDPDEPDEMEVNRSDSEEDVVVLGEKRPTYEEITLEEDDEGEVREKVVEKEKQEPKSGEEPLYECTFCDKSFRVESLLKFHVKMHNSSKPVISEPSSSMTSPAIDDRKTVDNTPKKKRHSVDNQDESRQKVNSKYLHKHRTRQEKHKSHKHKKHKRSIST